MSLFYFAIRTSHSTFSILPLIVRLITLLLRWVGRLVPFKPGLTTPVGWLVTPTDRPKSVRNRCVIEVFGGVCVLSFGFRIFCWYRGFCHRTGSDLLFLLKINGTKTQQMDASTITTRICQRKLISVHYHLCTYRMKENTCTCIFIWHLNSIHSDTFWNPEAPDDKLEYTK